MIHKVKQLSYFNTTSIVPTFLGALNLKHKVYKTIIQNLLCLLQALFKSSSNESKKGATKKYHSNLVHVKKKFLLEFFNIIIYCMIYLAKELFICGPMHYQ